MSEVSIDVDKDGHPFELSKALLLYFLPKYTGAREIPSTYYEHLNGITVQNDIPMINLGNAITNADKQLKKCGFWQIELDRENKIRHEKAVKGITYKENTVFGLASIGAKESGEVYKVNDRVESIKSIGFRYGLAFEGCRFILYGVRA